MSLQNLDDRSFDAKITSLKDELLSSGLTPDSFLNFERLVEILSTRVTGHQFSRDLLASINESISKDVIQNFRLSQFFEACAGFRRNAQNKAHNAQMHLQRLQKEKTEVSETLKQIKIADQMDPTGNNRRGMLILEVIGMQGLKVPALKPIYIKVNCYNSHFHTMAKQYSEQVFWTDKFTFELQTGFERVDVQVIATDLGIDEVIGVTQVHASSVKNPSYHQEWASLYNGKNYTPVGNILFGVQITSSKSEYLENILQKLEEHIKFQIEEIEDSEKNLRNLNTLVAPSYQRVEKQPTMSLKSPRSREHASHMRHHSEVLAGHVQKRFKNRHFRTIREEANSSDSESDNDDIKVPDFSNFARLATNYDHDTPEKNSLTRTVFVGNESNQARAKMAQSYVLEGKEGNIKGRNPFQNYNTGTVTGPGIGSYNAQSGFVSNMSSSLAETQAYTQSPPNDSIKTSIVGQDSTDKDAIINYLQKKLNESTLENERLSHIVNELTKGKQQTAKLESLQIKEYKNRVHEYETKIFALVSEIERLDKIANKNTNSFDKENDSIKPNQLVSAHNTEMENSLKALREENAKLTKRLSKKSEETAYWKSQAKGNKDRNENAHPNIKVEEQTRAKPPAQEKSGGVGGFLNKIFHFDGQNSNSKYEKQSVKGLSNGVSTAAGEKKPFMF